MSLPRVVIVSSAASLFFWLNSVNEIIGSKVLFVCEKDAIRLAQTDNKQLCLVDARHECTLEGEAFNVCLDFKRLLAILRQAMADDLCKLSYDGEKKFGVTLHSSSRQVTLDVPVRPLLQAMAIADSPKPTFEVAVPTGVWKNFLSLTRVSDKVIGLAVVGEPKALYMCLFVNECRALYKINGNDKLQAESPPLDVPYDKLQGFFRQIYHLGIIKSIFKGLPLQQRVVMRLHQDRPLHVILPMVGGRGTRFVVANVTLEPPTPDAKEQATPESIPSASGDDDDLPDLIADGSSGDSK